jgi:hypothetical protein
VTHSARGSARRERQHRGRQQAADRPGGSSWLSQVPYWIVVCGVVAGLLWMRGGQADVRSGTLVMAGVLLAGAAARLGLPERRAGLLGSRRRLADAAAFAALGVGLLVAGLIYPV